MDAHSRSISRGSSSGINASGKSGWLPRRSQTVHYEDLYVPRLIQISKPCYCDLCNIARISPFFSQHAVVSLEPITRHSRPPSQVDPHERLSSTAPLLCRTQSQWDRFVGQEENRPKIGFMSRYRRDSFPCQKSESSVCAIMAC